MVHKTLTKGKLLLNLPTSDVALFSGRKMAKRTAQLVTQTLSTADCKILDLFNHLTTFRNVIQAHIHYRQAS